MIMIGDDVIKVFRRSFSGMVSEIGGFIGLISWINGSIYKSMSDTIDL